MVNSTPPPQLVIVYMKPCSPDKNNWKTPRPQARVQSVLPLLYGKSGEATILFLIDHKHVIRSHVDVNSEILENSLAKHSPVCFFRGESLPFLRRISIISVINKGTLMLSSHADRLRTQQKDLRCVMRCFLLTLQRTTCQL